MIYCKLVIMFERLVSHINRLHPMTEEMTLTLRSLVKMTNYKAGEKILREGEVCNKAYFVVKGLIRSYYMSEDRDITSRFMEEENFITSWPSYFLQKPSIEFIVAMEDSVLLCIEYNSIQKLYNEYPEFNIIGRKLTEYAFYLSEQRTQMLRKHTAEEKYRFFLDNHPTLLQRVPLKYIATYLGMNEETLSRVRSRFHKKKF